MFDSLETGIGLDMILWIQEHRTAWMEVLAQILHLIGYDLGYVALFGFIFWAINKRHGLRLVFALITIGLVTFISKDFFVRTRPELVSDLIMPVFEEDGYSFPSGHSTFAVMIWGYIGLWLRKGWVWALIIPYIFLQGVARLVAGVHFPQDVLGGFLIGMLTLALYFPFANNVERFWKQQIFSLKLATVTLVPLALIIIASLINLEPTQLEDSMTMLGLALGVGLGATIQDQYIPFEPHPQIARRVIHFVLSAILMIAILLGLSPLFDLIAETGTIAYALRVIRYALAGFTGIALAPWLGIQLGLMQTLERDIQPA